MGLTALWTALGIALGAGGLVVIIRLRRGGEVPGMSLAGVGPLSRVSQLIIGLSLLGTGYHVAVHALGVMQHFRAPLAIAVGVAVVAILGSIGVDALERRLEERDADGGHDHDPP